MGTPSAAGMCKLILEWALITGPFIFLGDLFLIVMSILALAAALGIYSCRFEPRHRECNVYIPGFMLSCILLLIVFVIMVAIIQVTHLHLEDILVERRLGFRGTLECFHCTPSY